MLKKILFALAIKIFLLWPLVAEGNTFGRYGPGIGDSSGSHMISFGYTQDLVGPLMFQLEGGGFADTAGNGRHGSGFGAISLGIEVNPGYFVLRSVHGLSVLTTPDVLLGGWFQFKHDVLIGVRDHKGNIFGLNLTHMASAGINEPNVGRDAITVHVEIPW